MSVFDNMTDDKIQAAQDKLNELCDRHEIEKFDIQEKDGPVCWRKLVQAMCGIDINYREKSGRKANSDEFLDDVRRLYALHTDFSRLEIHNDKDKTKETTYKALPDFYDYQVHGFIADSLSKKYGKKIKPSKIRGILDNEHNRERLERLTQEEFKELANAPFDPDRFFVNTK